MEQTVMHQESESHEREQEETQKEESLTEEVFDTVTTINGTDTTKTMRHGVREVRREATGKTKREAYSETKDEVHDTLVAEEEKGRVSDCREEDAGLARYVLGAIFALLILFTITKTKTKTHE